MNLRTHKRQAAKSARELWSDVDGGGRAIALLFVANGLLTLAYIAVFWMAWS